MKKNFWLLMAATMTSAVSAVETTENMAKTNVQTKDKEVEIGPQPQYKPTTSNADEQAINNLTQKITAILPEIKAKIRKTRTGQHFLEDVNDNDAAKELAVWIKNLDLSRYSYTSELGLIEYLDIVNGLGDEKFPKNWCRLDIEDALSAISKKYDPNNKMYMDFSKVLFE